MLEETPEQALWIFTTTNAGQERLFEDQIDANPLLQRCLRINLRAEAIAPYYAKSKINPAVAQRLKQIAETEGLDGRPVEEYAQLLWRESGSMRGALNAIQAGEMLRD